MNETIKEIESITVYFDKTPGMGNKAHVRNLLNRLISQHGFRGSLLIIYHEQIRPKLKHFFALRQLSPALLQLDLSNSCLFDLTQLKKVELVSEEYFRLNFEKFPWTDLAIISAPYSSYFLDCSMLKAKRVLDLHPPGFAVFRGYRYQRADTLGEMQLPISPEAISFVATPSLPAVDACLMQTKDPSLKAVAALVKKLQKNQLELIFAYGMDLKVLEQKSFPVEYLLLNLAAAAGRLTDVLSKKPLVIFLAYSLSEAQLHHLRDVLAGGHPSNFMPDVISAIQERFLACKKLAGTRFSAFSAAHPDAVNQINTLSFRDIGIISADITLPPEIFHTLVNLSFCATAEGANLIDFLMQRGISFIRTQYDASEVCSGNETGLNKIDCEARMALLPHADTQRELWLHPNTTRPDEALYRFLEKSLEGSAAWRKRFSAPTKEDMLNRALSLIDFSPVHSVPHPLHTELMCDAIRNNLTSSICREATGIANPYDAFCQSGSSLLGLALNYGHLETARCLAQTVDHLVREDALLAWQFLFSMEEPSEANRWNGIASQARLILDLMGRLGSEEIQHLSPEKQKLAFGSVLALGRKEEAKRLLQSFPQLLRTTLGMDSNKQPLSPLCITIAGHHWDLMKHLLLQGATFDLTAQHYLVRFGTPELIEHYGISLPDLNEQLRQIFLGQNLPMLQWFLSHHNNISQSEFYPGIFGLFNADDIRSANFQFLRTLYPYLSLQDQELLLKNIMQRYLMSSSFPTLPVEMLSLILEHTRHQPFTSIPTPEMTGCQPSLQAAVLYGQPEPSLSKVLKNYSEICSTKRQEKVEKLLACYRRAVSQNKFTEAQAITDCEKMEDSPDVIPSDSIKKVTASHALLHETWYSTRNGFIYGFIEECIESAAEVFQLSSETIQWLRRTGKFLIAALIEETWESGILNTMTDLLLSVGGLSPKAASYLSTSISMAFMGYMYLQVGLAGTMIRLVGSCGGNWLGRKAFSGIKCCFSFFHSHDTEPVKKSESIRFSPI